MPICILDLERLQYVSKEDVLYNIGKYFTSKDPIRFIIAPDNESNKLILKKSFEKNYMASPPVVNFIPKLPKKSSKEAIDLNAYIDRPDTNRNIIWKKIYDLVLVDLPIKSNMYEVQQTADSFRPEAADKRSKTFYKYSENFIKCASHTHTKSVMDMGCGSGFLYELLKDKTPNIEYKGFDLSRAQISNAMENYPSDCFDVRDISHLNREDFNKFDALFCWSVLPFMDLEKQLHLLKEILSSSINAYFELTATRQSAGFMPNVFFMNFTKDKGRAILTPVSFLDVDVVCKLLDQSKKYSYFIEEFVYGKPCLPSFSKKPKGFSMNNISFKIVNFVFRAINFKRGKKAIRITIIPKVWEKSISA